MSDANSSSSCQSLTLFFCAFVTNFRLFYWVKRKRPLPASGGSQGSWLQPHTLVLPSCIVNFFDNDFCLEDEKACVLTALGMLRGTQACRTEESSLSGIQIHMKCWVFTFKVTMPSAFSRKSRDMTHWTISFPLTRSTIQDLRKCFYVVSNFNNWDYRECRKKSK